MVSKAREDLPDPETPVITVSVLRGISRLMLLRLCSRAPRMTMCVLDVDVAMDSPGSRMPGPTGSGEAEQPIILHAGRPTRWARPFAGAPPVQESAGAPAHRMGTTVARPRAAGR